MTSSYQRRREELNAAMTVEERTVYDEAYTKAALAMRVAELFYDARAASGLTQTELATQMHTTQPAIADIEGGARTPTIDMLARLAEATGQDLNITLTART